VGDGALGFRGALREVFPEAREGRCWFRKTANVLAALPRSAHPAAKKALAEIWGAEDKPHALAAAKAFEAACGAKFPEAVAKITGDLGQMLAGCGPGDGIQADRVSAGPLARRQRASPRRARAGRGLTSSAAS
jgi:transposase-like protein